MLAEQGDIYALETLANEAGFDNRDNDAHDDYLKAAVLGSTAALLSIGINDSAIHHVLGHNSHHPNFKKLRRNSSSLTVFLKFMM